MACLCDVMVVVAQVRSVHERSSLDFFLVIDHPLSPALCPISRAIESDLLRLRLLGLRTCFCLAQPRQACTRSSVSRLHFSPRLFPSGIAASLRRLALPSARLCLAFHSFSGVGWHHASFYAASTTPSSANAWLSFFSSTPIHGCHTTRP